jgi:hypothetical protein
MPASHGGGPHANSCRPDRALRPFCRQSRIALRDRLLRQGKSASCDGIITPGHLAGCLQGSIDPAQRFHTYERNRPIGRIPIERSPGQPGGVGRKALRGIKPLLSFVRPCPVRDCRRRVTGLIRKPAQTGKTEILLPSPGSHRADEVRHRFEPSHPCRPPVPGGGRGQGREASPRTFRLLVKPSSVPGGMCNRRTRSRVPPTGESPSGQDSQS